MALLLMTKNFKVKLLNYISSCVIQKEKRGVQADKDSDRARETKERKKGEGTSVSKR